MEIPNPRHAKRSAALVCHSSRCLNMAGSPACCYSQRPLFIKAKLSNHSIFDIDEQYLAPLTPLSRKRKEISPLDPSLQSYAPTLTVSVYPPHKQTFRRGTKTRYEPLSCRIRRSKSPTARTRRRNRRRKSLGCYRRDLQ